MAERAVGDVSCRVVEGVIRCCFHVEVALANLVAATVVLPVEGLFDRNAAEVRDCRMAGRDEGQGDLVEDREDLLLADLYPERNLTVD